jgi:hypothetical protein
MLSQSLKLQLTRDLVLAMLVTPSDKSQPLNLQVGASDVMKYFASAGLSKSDQKDPHAWYRYVRIFAELVRSYLVLEARASSQEDIELFTNLLPRQIGEIRALKDKTIAKKKRFSTRVATASDDSELEEVDMETDTWLRFLETIWETLMGD